MERHPFIYLIILAAIISLSGCSGGGPGGNTTGGPGGNTTGINCSLTATSPTATSSCPNGSGCATVIGKVTYEDKKYDQTGFTGTLTYQPIRYAQIEVVNSATCIVMATGVSDKAGDYHISFAPPASSSVYVRVISSTARLDKPPIEVRNMSDALYSVASRDYPPFPNVMDIVDIAIPATNAAGGGAFNIMDVYTSSGEFVQSLAGKVPKLITAFWEVGENNGTYYCHDCSLGDEVSVKSETGGDTDEYDDDVLWHEYGHFIANHFSKDNSPGGEHYIDSNDLDLRLAWSEGWGNFFPAAVKTWLSTNSAPLSAVSSMPMSYYVDTINGDAGIAIDIAKPTTAHDLDPDPYTSSASEIAIAKVLWDMSASFGGMQPIWNVITSDYFKTVTTPVNMETFWDGWLLARSSNADEIKQLQDIYGERSIFYKEDSYEELGDDATPPARTTPFTVCVGTASCAGETHYLFKADRTTDDKDVISFTATAGATYTITTFDLKNGADTYLSLLAPDGTMRFNDNSSGLSYTTPPLNCDSPDKCPKNGNDLLASRIILAATAPRGKYFVEVRSSSSRPVSAGRYGSYTLKITSP